MFRGLIGGAISENSTPEPSFFEDNKFISNPLTPRQSHSEMHTKWRATCSVQITELQISVFLSAPTSINEEAYNELVQKWI